LNKVTNPFYVHPPDDVILTEVFKLYSLLSGIMLYWIVKSRYGRGGVDWDVWYTRSCLVTALLCHRKTHYQPI